MASAICVVRVQDQAYRRGDTYFCGKSVRVIKRETEHDVLADEVDGIGIADALSNIVNLHECRAGLYQMVLCNKSYDIESGLLDGWSWKLVAIEVK